MAKALEGKVAIVTGSGQGIGKGIAVYLAREGAKVITNNRKPGGKMAEKYHKEDMPEDEWQEFLRLKGDAELTARVIQDEGGMAVPVYGDASESSVAEKMVQTAVDSWGRVDIVVNNAAATGTGGVMSLSEDDWDRLTYGRAKAAYQMSRFAAPYMMKQGFGRFINLASDAWIGLSENIAYSCSTAGMVGFSWSAAKEFYGKGITVNVFCPQGASPAHAVEYNKLIREITKATGKAPDPAILAAVEADHGDPVNIGPFAAYLCTDDAGFITGNVFSVTSSGKVMLYANPKHVSEIAKQDGMWTAAELKTVVPNQLLGPDYKSDAKPSFSR